MIILHVLLILSWQFSYLCLFILFWQFVKLFLSNLWWQFLCLCLLIVFWQIVKLFSQICDEFFLWVCLYLFMMFWQFMFLCCLIFILQENCVFYSICNDLNQIQICVRKTKTFNFQMWQLKGDDMKKVWTCILVFLKLSSQNDNLWNLKFAPHKPNSHVLSSKEFYYIVIFILKILFHPCDKLEEHKFIPTIWYDDGSSFDSSISSICVTCNLGGQFQIFALVFVSSLWVLSLEL